MVTLTWIDGQIEKAIEEGNNPQNIRDLAALITVREYLAARSAPKADAQSVQESADDKRRRDAVVLMTHSADLETLLSMAEIAERHVVQPLFLAGLLSNRNAQIVTNAGHGLFRRQSQHPYQC